MIKRKHSHDMRAVYLHNTVIRHYGVSLFRNFFHCVNWMKTFADPRMYGIKKKNHRLNYEDQLIGKRVNRLNKQRYRNSRRSEIWRYFDE
jgi:hypothetical protein